ncbi:FtsK/SpoIIIE domain-containing protein [Pseudoclavibacter terrae]|uniref:FtsK/SpoIIIE domain-containing protein n=1 Tax=Pseudoclavibacter terrae TaxID=1530195 RepID=UPI00232EDF82|nr:FtsK/SpoIIIE domain-containing protein [Pseudoclavibacter terrae]
MSALFDSIGNLVQPLIGWFIELLPVLIGGLVVISLLVWLYTRLHNKLAQLGQRWLGYEEGHSFWHASTWFKIEPLNHFRAKAKILANDEIVSVYVPMNRREKYMRNLRDKEKPRKLAWLSAFPDGVKMIIAATPTPSGKILNARKLISYVAKQIEVCSLPEGVYVSGDPDKHYRINLATVGKDPATIEKIENNLLTQLALYGGIDKYDSGNPTQLSYIAHEAKVIDPLTEQKIGVDWLNEHKATSPYALPLAITREGKPLIYNMHHGMCGGASGTGKGSFIQAMIWQLADQVEKGLVEIWIVDPKWSEAKLYERNRSSLIKHISVGMDEDGMRRHAETIHKLKSLIARRIAQDNTSIEEGKVQDGRDFKATRENPMIVVFIDEYPTLYSGLNLLGKDGKAPQAELLQIVATGRSLGVFIEGATQKFDKTILEAVRDNIANWWLLGQDSAYYNDLFLGEGARAAGYDTTAIPRSSLANDYATAGIGYAKDESGAPVAFRLPFVSKEDMGALIRRFQALDGKRTPPVVVMEENPDDGKFAITDSDDYEEELPNLELIDFDDPHN